jgi:S-methyl-5-thioribose-1-phosphate isomerase
MRVNGKHYRTVWMQGSVVYMIDQNLLPFEFKIFEAKSYRECCTAISKMITRGAGAIGAAAGFAMAQAFIESKQTGNTDLPLMAKNEIEATRPTARNLFFATERVYDAGKISAESAIREAQKLADENIEAARLIGTYGEKLIETGFRIGTHCNAGWLGFVDYGSALSPVYTAAGLGKNIFVYIDETRPRNQGARLTAWELQNEGIPHVIIPDNAAAYFMSQGLIDIMIVGADRIASNGDVANKIGTFEKAIVAREFGIPFYCAAPLSTFDLTCMSGEDVVIEMRNQDEVHYQTGLDSKGTVLTIMVSNPGSQALNPAFDVTPSKYISGIITEKGIISADNKSIQKLFA